MQHQPIDSKNIKTIGYDPDARTLHVDFHGSGMYVYHDVHPSMHEQLMNSDSKGGFLHKHVKGKHRHVKA